MVLVSPRGRCWFGVESIFFEILIKEVKRKLVGKICERGQDFSSWIRFGGKGLALLLEGVEACCAIRDGKSFRLDWMEDGRSYKLVLRNNRAGQFLLCTATSV